MEELWKAIPEYEGRYEVSNYGRVRSLDRVSKGRRYKGKMIKPYEHNEYLKVKLHNGIKSKGFRVHRLVAQAFLILPQRKYEVHHIDHDKKNNHASNLKWVDRSENMLFLFEFNEDKENKDGF